MKQRNSYRAIFLGCLLYCSSSVVVQPGVNSNEIEVSVDSPATGNLCAECPNWEDRIGLKIWGSNDRLLYQRKESEKGTRSCYETLLEPGVPCMYNGSLLFPLGDDTSGAINFERPGESVMCSVEPTACPSLDPPHSGTPSTFDHGHHNASGIPVGGTRGRVGLVAVVVVVLAF
ncbi:hypothetical protein AAFF_G00264780 [Aldrovandia affinis]|uniref:Uncharacterized protein n=1 Tax=Aldrovandia affinis TaxID=143900 RepID=A0AAD7RC81_9TELE|nr:hypothetical protein AAFF_G00264780 [Aldrovandia affinis]